MRIIFVVLIFVELLMGSLTYLTYNESISQILFSGGSISSTMRFFGPNFWVIFILYLLTILVTVLFRKRIKTLLISFVCVCSLWFFCGRTIGILWTGEIITGWFYIKTDEVFLCNSDKDHSDNIIDETLVSDTYLFRMSFKNRFVEKNLFVGPMIHSEIKNYFNGNEPNP